MSEAARKRRVLMLTHTYHPSIGGGIRYKKAVVEHLRDRGHQVDILALNAGGEPPVQQEAGGRVLRVQPQIRTPLSPISFSYLRTYRRLAPAYDVLLFNFPSPMEEIAEVLFGSAAKGARKVVMYHADIVDAKRFAGLYNRMITRPFLRGMDAVIVSSPRIGESSPHLAPHGDRIHVIPFGIDLDVYGRPEPCPVKTDQSEVRLLFVGRMSRYKGIDVLLRAFASVDGGRLRLVGEGPLRAEMETLARELALGERVEFVGRIPDGNLLTEYHAADVLVLPSTDAGEAFGYVLIEAMAGRTAIVSTELGTGTSWVNRDGETGLVVRPDDVGELACAIGTLLEDQDRRRAMQEAAYRHAVERFDIRRMLEENEAVIMGEVE